MSLCLLQLFCGAWTAYPSTILEPALAQNPDGKTVRKWADSQALTECTRIGTTRKYELRSFTKVSRPNNYEHKRHADVGNNIDGGKRKIAVHRIIRSVRYPGARLANSRVWRAGPRLHRSLRGAASAHDRQA